jgi:predicted NUDIX family NTP pyrophosphohydrolase
MAVEGEFLDLGVHKQPGGKTIVTFAHEGDFDPASLTSNAFAIEWPPHSGRMAEFPEVDRAAWFDLAAAMEKATRGQRPILAALAEKLGVKRPDGE